METPNREDFPKPRIGTEPRLDRMAERRTDKAWLAERLADPASRFLLFADLSLAVDSNADQSETRLRWYTPEQVEKLGASITDAFLLGCDEDGNAVFVMSLDA